MAAGFSGRLFYSKETFQDSIVRVWVEMFTPTLTSLLWDAELVEALRSVAEPAEAIEAASCLSESSNLYGIKYPFSSICLTAFSADPSTLNSKT